MQRDLGVETCPRQWLPEVAGMDHWVNVRIGTTMQRQLARAGLGSRKRPTLNAENLEVDMKSVRTAEKETGNGVQSRSLNC
jgi:hypothetical protein